MTFKELHRLIVKYDIPEDVWLLSDSGWECSETVMDGPYYNSEKNQIIFTQSFNRYDKYFKMSAWIRLK